MGPFILLRALVSATTELLKGRLEPLCKDNFIIADGVVTKGMFGSMENTLEENDFILELSLKVDSFEAPLSFSTLPQTHLLV